MKLKTFIELSRAEHAAMIAVAVLFGEFLTIGFNVPFLPTALAVLSTVFITLAAFIYGDYHDIETDILNKRRDRPLARKEIDPQEALIAAIVLFGLGIFLSFFISETIFAITLIFAILSILYGYSLKKIPVLGNLTIALCMNIPYVYGGLIVSKFVALPVFFIAFSSFFFGFGREIIKSIEDVYGDKKTGRITLPMITGIKASEWVCAVSILLAVAVQLYMFFKINPFFGQLGFFIPTLIGDLIVTYALFLVLERKEYRKVRNLTLIAPIFVLLGVFLVLVF